MFEREGMVARVDGNQDVRSVFQDVLLGLKPAHEKEVLDAHQMAAEAISTGDMEAYAEVGARWLVGWLRLTCDCCLVLRRMGIPEA